MYCKNCGARLKDGAKFCPKCGAKQDIETNIIQKNERKRFHWVWIVIGCVVIIAAVAIGVAIGLHNSNEKTMDEDTLASDSAENTAEDIREDIDVEDYSEENEFTPEESVLIDDYSKVLNPEEYIRFDGDYDRFYFYYPKNLYEKMDNLSDDDGQYIAFYDTNGSSSRACFNYFIRIDQDSQKEKYESLYKEHWNSLYDAEQILAQESTNDGGARFILTGYEDADRQIPAYDLVYITDQAVMQMYITYPKESDIEDKNHKWYYVECMYRMCGFSNSSRDVRTWEAYSESN